MTREEHKARAMLLGYNGVNMRLGYYFRFINKYPRYEYLDLKTLEPINVEEQIRRRDYKDERFGASSREWNGPWYEDA